MSLGWACTRIYRGGGSWAGDFSALFFSFSVSPRLLWYAYANGSVCRWRAGPRLFFFRRYIDLCLGCAEGQVYRRHFSRPFVQLERIGSYCVRRSIWRRSVGLFSRAFHVRKLFVRDMFGSCLPSLDSFPAVDFKLTHYPNFARIDGCHLIR